MSSPPLNGLLLIGGRSKRMGSDKASLVVNGAESLRDRGLRLLSGITDQQFLSVGAGDERDHPAPTIPDVFPNRGPLGGLHSAFLKHPGCAWLLLACDLPSLSADTLQLLVANRDPARDVTCFQSPHDQLPEPLCTIFEPSAASAVAQAVTDKRLCARRLLSTLDCKTLELPEKASLLNCNRPEDLEELRLLDQQGAVQKNVTIEYFAKLRDEAGTDREQVTTEAATAAGLWDEIRMRHALSLSLDSVRLAINDEFAPWTSPLTPNDRIAFMPPFAGG